MKSDKRSFKLSENILEKNIILEKKIYWFPRYTTSGKLLSGSWDSTILEFDLNHLRFIKKIGNEQQNGLSVFKSAVTSLIKFSTGKIISGLADCSIQVFDINLNKCLATLKGHLESVWSLLIAHSNILISGDGSGLIKIWCLNQFNCTKTLRGHTCSVNCLLLTKDNLIISGGGDRSIRVWDWEKCIIHLEEHTGSVHCILIVPEKYLISGSSDSTIKFWNLGNRMCVKKLKQNDWVRALVLLEVDKIISCLHNGEINIWNFVLNFKLKTLKYSDDSIWCSLLLAHNEFITGYSNGKITVWDLKMGMCIKKIQRHASIVNSLVIVN